MKKSGSSFYDYIEGNVIYSWIDCYNIEWLANNKWGFRCKRHEN